MTVDALTGAVIEPSPDPVPDPTPAPDPQIGFDDPEPGDDFKLKEAPAETPAPAPEPEPEPEPVDARQRWVCVTPEGPRKVMNEVWCKIFHSDSHKQNIPVVCPTCGNPSVRMARDDEV